VENSLAFAACTDSWAGQRKVGEKRRNAGDHRQRSKVRADWLRKVNCRGLGQIRPSDRASLDRLRRFFKLECVSGRTRMAARQSKPVPA
jgi:hypothetical protein